MNSPKKSNLLAILFKVIRALLLGLFGVQASLLYLAQKEVELPRSACNWLAEKLSPDGLRLEIRKGTLRRLVFLELNDITISAASGKEPLVQARRAGAFFNWKNFATPGKRAQFFFCDGVQVNCPSSRSQTGSPEKIIENGRASATYSFGEIQLHSLFAQVADVPLSASGIFPLSELLDGLSDDEHTTDSSPTPEETEGSSHVPSKRSSTLAGFYAFAETLSSAKHRLEERNIRPGGTGIQIAFEPTEDGELVVDIDAFCGNVMLPNFHVSAKNIHAQAQATLDLRKRCLSAVSPIVVSAETLRAQVIPESFLDAWNISVEKPMVALTLQPEKGILLPNALAVSAPKILVKNFTEGDFEFSGTLIQASQTEATKTLLVNTHVLNSPIAAQIDFNEDDGLRVVLDTRLDFLRWLHLPQAFEVLPGELAHLNFTEKPHIQAALRFSPDWQFRNVDYALSAGAATWQTIAANSVFSAGTFTPDAINIREAQVRGDNYCANARIFVELGGGKNYRVQAFGSVENPEVLDDYLGWFWWRIWKNLELVPSEKAPRADIDVYGKWDSSLRWEYIYGAIAGENVLGGGVHVDKVRLRIAEEPEFVAAFDMGVERGEHTVTGTLLWNYALKPEYHYQDFRFAFSGTVAPHDAFDIIGEGLPELFEGILEREEVATASACGFISGDTRFYPEDRIMVEIDVTDASGDVSFLGIQGSDFVGKINYDSGNIRLSSFRANCGGGQVDGDVLVKLPPEMEAEGTQLAIDLNLQNISGSYLSEMSQNLIPQDTETEESDFEKTPASTSALPDDSRISTSFKASMTLPDVDTLKAHGAFDYYDPSLFDLRFFGGFSRFLETIKIPITSFSFTNATATFSIQDGKIYLPDLMIEGDSGEISAQINMRFSDQALAGEAVFKNRRFTDLPLLGKAFELFSESTTLFPLEISGTLDDVQWKARPFGNFLKSKKNYGTPPASKNASSQ